MGTKNNTESFVSSALPSGTTTFSSSANHQHLHTGTSAVQQFGVQQRPHPQQPTPPPSQQRSATSSSGGGRVLANPSSASSLNASLSAAQIADHRLSMQLSKPPTTGSIGVSVITPAAGVANPQLASVTVGSQKEAQAQQHKQQQQQHFKQQILNQQQQQQKIQNRNVAATHTTNESYGRSNVGAYTTPTKLASSPTTGVTITPISSAYMPSKASKIVGPSPTASIVYSHTQHLPKYISSSRFLVNTDKGDVFINDDGTLGEIPDKRAQYSNHLPPDYQYVLQDHSYSQLPESPPPPPTPPTPTQRTTINGLSRINSSATPTKVTLNNNRLVTVSGGSAQLLNNFSSSSHHHGGTAHGHGHGRLNNQQQQQQQHHHQQQLHLQQQLQQQQQQHHQQQQLQQHHHPHHHQPSSGLLTQVNNNSMNSYSSVSAIVNSVAASIHNNTSTSVIAVNPKKHFGPQTGHSSLAGVPKSLLKVGALDRRDESDLSEDDRIPDPHGEETETAPEAEEESVTRCVCDFQHDDGYMISCDKCLVWQHVVCMGISWNQIPEEYQCEKCQPRYIDKKRAVEIQKKKIAEKLCVGVNDDSDSSDTPAQNARGGKPKQTTRKYKGRRTQNKRKTAKENIKEGRPTKRASGAGFGAGSGPGAGSKKRQFSDGIGSAVSPPISPSLSSNLNMSAERKKQLLLERKQMLLEKKNTKRPIRKPQTQNSKRNLDKSKTMDDEYERKSTGAYTDREEDSDHNIQQVREWVDRYEEAVTNHYSQELRARLSAVQVNGVHSDLKYTTLLKSVEKCKSSLLSTGGKIVVTTSSISPNQPIIELRGKYMWTGAASFKQNDISPSTPYVFYYRLPKQDIEICVDCRKYGNFARFVRRSCKPNSELRHCIRKTSLHLYIIATQTLKKNSEILIGHFSPETANSCVCGSPESCTAAKTPYPTPVSRYGDKHSRESPSIRSTSSSNKKIPLNAEKGKKRLKEDKRKLTKEKRRGRRRSPSSGSNSDQEGSSSRDQSPTVPAKLTVNMWAKSTLNPSSSSTVVNDTAASTTIANRNSNNNNNNNNENSAGEDMSDNESHSENEMPPSPGPNSNQAEESKPPVSSAMVSASQSEPATSNGLNASSNSLDNHSDSEKPAATTPTTPNNAASTKTPNSKATHNSDYAKKVRQQLDKPAFSQTPNNHKMTREEKKIQAIMKAFEQMEKLKTRNKHRRESTSDAEPCAGKKTPCRKSSTATTKSRKNTDTSESGRRLGDDENCVKNSRKSSQTTEEEDDDAKPSSDTPYSHHRAHTMKEEPKSDDGYRKQSYIVENGSAVHGFKTETEDDDSEDASGQNRGTDNEDEKPSIGTAAHESAIKMVSPKKMPPSGGALSPVKVNNTRFEAKTPAAEPSDKEPAKRKRNEGVAATPKNKSVKIQSPSRTRSTKPTPRGKATLRTKALRGEKRKSESGAEDSPDTDPAAGDISERTRSAVQRQKKTTFTKPTKDDKKNSLANSPSKFKKTEDPTVSPFSTPPKSRERLDSSSSSGGTPPTPVSDTCLLVAAAVGHLTDFKFPNTKKELMNAWFKEERKPSPDEEAPNKLTNQESGNEYAKKRWLRQAISEEGDSSGPRSEEVVSPNGDYGGPLKKRRFARESMSEQTCSSPTAGSFGSGGGGESNQNETKSSVTEETDSSKNVVAKDIRSSTPPAENAPTTPTPPADMDKDESTIVVGSVLSSVLSAVANVDNQMPPAPPSPRCVTPPPKATAKKPPEAASPPISKKKLSLTEYKQRKSTATPTMPAMTGAVMTTAASSLSSSAAAVAGCSDVIGDVVQEVPALALAPLPTIDPAETVERSSSRSSITSSSCSEEEDNSHAASAQVIARSLMMETRHLSYGPQASALFNSIRSGSLGAAGTQPFNAKPNPSGGAALPRENLADRLKREFDVHVQEDEAEKNRTMPPPLSPIKMHVAPVPPPGELVAVTAAALGTTPKDLHLRLKKIQPPPPPPPLPAMPLPTLPPSMPLPDPSQLFAPYYSYPAVPRMPSYFTAPPPPPPPVPPPVPPPLLPPPPPPPPPQ